MHAALAVDREPSGERYEGCREKVGGIGLALLGKTDTPLGFDPLGVTPGGFCVVHM